MNECVQPYYIMDGEILDQGSFHIGLINEGKSIYEVARLSGNRLLFQEDHLDRFFYSLDLEGIKSKQGRKEISVQLKNLIKKNPVKEGNIKFLLNIRAGQTPSFLAYFVAHRYPSDLEYTNGVKVASFPFERTDPNKKIWRPAFRQEIREYLIENNAFEALLLDSKGCLPEASKSNIFAIRDSTIITPPDKLILPGITRKYVLESCSSMGIPVLHRTIPLGEIGNLDGLFLTGTSIHVLPVNQVDAIKLPTENKIMRNIMNQFQITIQNT